MTIYPLAESGADDFPEFFLRVLEPALREAGIAVLASYATEHSENTYPALPVRDRNVFVWMTMFEDEEDHARSLGELERSPAWIDGVSEALAQRLDGEAEILRLAPTARSLIHG